MTSIQNFNAKDFLKKQNLNCIGCLSVGKHVHIWEHKVKAFDDIAYGLIRINIRTRCETCRVFQAEIHFWVGDYITSIDISYEVFQQFGYDDAYYGVKESIETHNLYMIELHEAAANYLC